MEFCQPWILVLLGELTKPLTEATRNEEAEPVAWGPEREQAFKAIKGALASAPALGLPDNAKPFNLYVPERKAGGVTTQKLGPHQRPVAYYSAQPGPVAAGAPACMKSVPAAATILEKKPPLNSGTPRNSVCPTRGRNTVETVCKPGNITTTGTQV